MEDQSPRINQEDNKKYRLMQPKKLEFTKEKELKQGEFVHNHGEITNILDRKSLERRI